MRDYPGRLSPYQDFAVQPRLSQSDPSLPCGLDQRQAEATYPIRVFRAGVGNVREFAADPDSGQALAARNSGFSWLRVVPRHICFSRGDGLTLSWPGHSATSSTELFGSIVND